MGKVFEALLAIAGVLLFAVVALPAIAGYGYAVTMFPAYDQSDSCKGRKADPIQGDDYRVYLLNRGCNIQEALAHLGKDLRMDPARLMSLYKGQARPSSADEVSGWDAVQAELRSFKSLTVSGDGLSSFWGDDVISRQFESAFRKYFLTATPIFLGALDMGASHIAGVVQYGPLAEGALYIAYLIGLAILASALYDLLKRAFT